MSSTDSDDSDVDREDILSAFSGFDDIDEYAPLCMWTTFTMS